jgi:tetratricopeptide (TPR) repeat protein
LICDNILKNNSNYNVVLYHKERILFSMKKFDESISCCDRILEDYPDNGDVLFDKASNFVMLSNFDTALDLLEHAIFQGIEYKIKAKKSKSFEILFNNIRFQNLIN